MRKSCAVAFVLSTIASGASAQTVTYNDSSLVQADREARCEIPFPLSLLIPDGIREGYELRAYVRSEAFGAFDSSCRNAHVPEAAFDEIYAEAVAVAHGNRSDALLAAAFGSFEHESIPLDVFGSELDLPLTSETPEEFRRRVSHLPTYLYHVSEDDRDKLQHFFASAWLKSILGMDWLVRLAGHLVETGERLFVIGGFVDPRDLHANIDGLHFELRMEASPENMPSNSLTPNPEPSKELSN